MLSSSHYPPGIAYGAQVPSVNDPTASTLGTTSAIRTSYAQLGKVMALTRQAQDRGSCHAPLRPGGHCAKLSWPKSADQRLLPAKLGGKEHTQETGHLTSSDHLTVNPGK